MIAVGEMVVRESIVGLIMIKVVFLSRRDDHRRQILDRPEHDRRLPRSLSDGAFRQVSLQIERLG